MNMSKFICKCGCIINLSEGWSSNELALIPESRIEKIGDALDQKESLTIDQFYDLIDEVKSVVYRCEKCQRLHLEEDGKFSSYLKEVD